MPERRLFRSFCLIVCATLWGLPALAAQPAPVTERDWLLQAINVICPVHDMSGLDAQLHLPGSWLLDETRLPPNMPPRLVRMRFALPLGDEIHLERRLSGTSQRQFRVSYHAMTGAQSQPVLLAITDGNCDIQSGRRVRQEGEVERYLDHLDRDLQKVLWTEALQLPWPTGQDPAGPRVALVDSGLAYDLPAFRNSLARDPEGVPLGYDHWDLDPWPYDGDTSQNPFIPRRHGTPVASVLLREAPDVALVPYRYPRPDMSRMGSIVHDAAQNGVRILAMALGSRRMTDWDSFLSALEDHDMLAVVSAGNDGRDIDQSPLWPAVFDHDKLLVVTSADAAGRLAQGSNWGVRSVDIMVPAENVPVIDFRGASGKASGSSYAVPRVAALAARLLARAPNLSALELKQAILARAVASPYERSGVLAAGWIPDPLAD